MTQLYMTVKRFLPCFITFIQKLRKSHIQQPQPHGSMVVAVWYFSTNKNFCWYSLEPLVRWWFHEYLGEVWNTCTLESIKPYPFQSTTTTTTKIKIRREDNYHEEREFLTLVNHNLVHYNLNYLGIGNIDMIHKQRKLFYSRSKK